MACMCGDPQCPSCGTAQGTYDPGPASGRCSRCKENTVLERTDCETCGGTGSDPASADTFADDADCPHCEGRGYTESTPCCGTTLVDEAAEVDEAYDRLRDA